MKPFEYGYVVLQPLMLPLYGEIRRRLRTLVETSGAPVSLLDVGGRKSHYTVGVPARVTISDLPRESRMQHALNLGINEEMIDQTKSRRSNVIDVVYDDMTQTKFPTRSFDGVVAVEVLEHVEDDASFVSNVSRVLRPGGFFLMTTPNGDNDPVPAEDHKRHYRKAELQELLRGFFDDVRVDYAVVAGRWRTYGLQSWSIRHPVRTTRSMLGNVVNRSQSMRSGTAEQVLGTKHLIGTARNQRGASSH
ncbi:MAG: class I SAM-dependent methyltransferase [Acidimicrobiia bacterium]